MFTFNGDGIKTCSCCERKLTIRGGIYEGVCSAQCSTKQLEYNSIPINILFLKRLYLHLNDENLRNDEIERFIIKNRLNKEMTNHKIKRISQFILLNQLDKLSIKRNTVYQV
jgi:hypothetical protein